MGDTETAIETKSTVGIKGKRRLQRVTVKGDPYDFIVKSNLKQRDEEILELLYDMRVAKTSHIAEYLGVSSRWASKLLSKLYVNNFVHRDFMKVNRGSSEGYYFLDNMGAFYLAAIREMPKKEFSWSQRDNLVGIEKLTHTGDITEIRIRIELALRKSMKGKLIRFHGEKKTGRRQFEFDGIEFGINPDSEIIIHINKENKVFQRAYFLEYDRGTEELIKVSDKVKKYIKYYQSEEFKINYEVEPTLIIVCNGNLSEKRFRKAIADNLEEIDFNIYLVQYSVVIDDPLGSIYHNIMKDTSESILLV